MVYVPPKYPDEIPSAVDLPDRVDDVDWLYAERYNELKKELRAALIELGVLPKGAYADVRARLNALPPPYILLKDEKASGTNGGTFDTGAWRTRDINTEEIDTGNNCSIASNQITLAAGTYECLIKCPAVSVFEHTTRLYNITDSSVGLEGSVDSAHSNSFIIGRFIIAAQKTFEIQHYCHTSIGNIGFGKALAIAGVNEVYTIAEFRKVA